MHHFDSPLGAVQLERYPADPSGRLRAHDGADRFLLEEYAELVRRGDGVEDLPVLVLNDQYGALTTVLAQAATVVSATDSYLAARAIERNVAANRRTATVIRGLPERDRYAAVLARVPKSLGLLAAQLAVISGPLPAGTPVIAGGMTKHLSRGANSVISRYIGDVTPSLGKHKARLLRAAADPGRHADPPQSTRYRAAEYDVMLTTLPGVFAAEHLDIGARALLPHLPTELADARVVDLGCGNGVLAICSALDNPQASYTLIDESVQAIESARTSWHDAHSERPATLVLGDGLADAEPASYDVVLCNPPFHQGFAIDPHVATRLLDQAHAALRPGGVLYVVGNRQLRHEQHLRRHFRSVERLAATSKFTVHRAIR